MDRPFPISRLAGYVIVGALKMLFTLPWWLSLALLALGVSYWHPFS